MINLRYILYLCPAFLALAACSENGPDESAMSGNIQLGAAVGHLQIDSRATAVQWSGNSLRAEVWLRSGDSYVEDETTKRSIHTIVEFKSEENWQTDVTYSDQELRYPVDDSKVWCIGMYPVSGWDISTDNVSVSHTIDGSTDLMFAPEISGSWNNHFPTQKYEHLLTWIKISVCASSHEAEESWGSITSITVNSASKVTVNSQTGEYKYENPQEIETITADENGNGPVLTTTNQEVGSVFCSPAPEYTLTVTAKDKSNNTITKTVVLGIRDTEDVDNDGDREEEIPETGDAGRLRGKCYVFSLYFTQYNVIEGSCTLNSWSNQNEDIYPE